MKTTGLRPKTIIIKKATYFHYKLKLVAIFKDMGQKLQFSKNILIL